MNDSVALLAPALALVFGLVIAICLMIPRNTAPPDEPEPEKRADLPKATIRSERSGRR